jgi:hypothetical protein
MGEHMNIVLKEVIFCLVLILVPESVLVWASKAGRVTVTDYLLPARAGDTGAQRAEGSRTDPHALAEQFVRALTKHCCEKPAGESAADQCGNPDCTYHDYGD